MHRGEETPFMKKKADVGVGRGQKDSENLPEGSQMQFHFLSLN